MVLTSWYLHRWVFSHRFCFTFTNFTSHANPSPPLLCGYKAPISSQPQGISDRPIPSTLIRNSFSTSSFLSFKIGYRKYEHARASLVRPLHPHFLVDRLVEKSTCTKLPGLPGVYINTYMHGTGNGGILLLILIFAMDVCVRPVGSCTVYTAWTGYILTSVWKVFLPVCHVNSTKVYKISVCVVEKCLLTCFVQHTVIVLGTAK